MKSVKTTFLPLLFAMLFPLNINAKEPGKPKCDSGIQYLIEVNNKANSMIKRNGNIGNTLMLSNINRQLTAGYPYNLSPYMAENENEKFEKFLGKVSRSSLRKCIDENERIKEIEESLKKFTELNVYLRDWKGSVKREETNENSIKNYKLKLGIHPRTVPEAYVEIESPLLGKFTSKIDVDKKTKFMFKKGLPLGFYGKVQSEMGNFKKFSDNTTAFTLMKKVNYSKGRFIFSGDYSKNWKNDTYGWSVDSRLTFPLE